MTFKDLTQTLWDKVKTGSGFGREDGTESNMANGGFSGYHPNTARHRVTRDTTRQTPADIPQGENTGWEQGFTGYQPNQATGYQQPVNGMNQTGYQQPQATGYQQPMGGMNQTGYQNTWQTGYQQPFTGYQQPVNPWENQQAGYGMGQNSYTAPFTGYQPQENPMPDNIRYMPGNFVGEDGRAYSHVERVAVLSNVAACYRIIEFMRNNESVIVNTEQITDEAENQRCLDLLYGAAFAMNCSFTRIAAKSIYLIAPTSVMVVPYDAIRRMSDQDMNARWPETEREQRWDSTARHDSRSFTRSHPSYSAPRGWQEDYAGFGGYQAVGYNR